jgi:hypothetical protein
VSDPVDNGYSLVQFQVEERSRRGLAMARNQKQVWIDKDLLIEVKKFASKKGAEREDPMLVAEAVRILIKSGLDASPINGAN